MSRQKDRIEFTRKPKKCPTCGLSPVATIFYGMPVYSEELRQELDEGRTTLGGCCIGDDDPAWKCTKCGLRIYRKSDSWPEIDK